MAMFQCACGALFLWPIFTVFSKPIRYATVNNYTGGLQVREFLRANHTHTAHFVHIMSLQRRHRAVVSLWLYNNTTQLYYYTRACFCLSNVMHGLYLCVSGLEKPRFFGIFFRFLGFFRFFFKGFLGFNVHSAEHII